MPMSAGLEFFRQRSLGLGSHAYVCWLRIGATSDDGVTARDARAIRYSSRPPRVSRRDDSNIKPEAGVKKFILRTAVIII